MKTPTAVKDNRKPYVGFRLDADLRDRLLAVAAGLRLPVAWVIREALLAYLPRAEKNLGREAK